MQARAIFEAACNVAKKGGAPVVPEVMVPLVGIQARNCRSVKKRIEGVAATVMAEQGANCPIMVGTMIELPRAALRAKEIAKTRRVLQLRHQRPDPDHLRLVARRRRSVPRRSIRRRGIEVDPFSQHRSGRCRRTRQDRRRAGQGNPSGNQARHLRRTRRRPGFGRVLPFRRPDLRVLLALPRADRPIGRRAGRLGRRLGADQVIDRSKKSIVRTGGFGLPFFFAAVDSGSQERLLRTHSQGSSGKELRGR